MKKIKEVLIVEGVHDMSHLKGFLNADFLITGGTSLNQQFWDNLNAYKSANREFIIMTDADTSGEFIRKEIAKVVPNVKHVFIDAKYSKHKAKVGVEHASKELILKALDKLVSFDANSQTLTPLDLFELELTAKVNSKKRRDYLTEKLNIGSCNGKTLLFRLNGLGLSKERLIAILSELDNENK